MENKNTQEQKTPETLKPEQMESGKWYVVDTFLIKFEKIEEERIYRYKSFDLESKVDYSKTRNGFIIIEGDEKIRPATKEEVLKYFPDEVFEPIELRPEDLVSGEVYVATFNYGDRYKFIFKHRDTLKNQINYEKMINHSLQRFENANLDKSFKFYHATPEEKKLLLGEEETELEKVKKLLEESNRLYALKTIEFTKLQEKFEKLSAYNDELTERINQTETKSNQEKVYFYFNEKELLWLACTNKEFAIEFSKNNHPIYEAVCIGKKKSVLVSE